MLKRILAVTINTRAPSYSVSLDRRQAISNFDSRSARWSSYRIMADAGDAITLDASPKDGQLVDHDGKTYKTVKEGLAYILIPPNVKTSQDPQAKAKTGES